MSIAVLETPEPHFIPGYTGYCPQYLYRVGDTYGSLTHKLLLDPTITRSENLVLSDRTMDDYQVLRPPHKDLDIVKARFREGDPLYQHPMMAGYEGFIPRANKVLGQTFSVAAAEGLSEFFKSQMKYRHAAKQLQRTSQLQDGRYCPKSLEDKQLIKSQFRLPLLDVRPEQVAVTRDMPVTEPALQPPRQGYSPYFSDCDDPEKYLKGGFGGHVPFGFSRFGESNQPYTNSALCDFTNNYRMRMSTEWAPVSIIRPDPPLQIQATEIYPKHMGLLPGYLGHVPGQILRFGKTFGNDSQDAKRWLRGDFRV
ncbi:CIMIP2 protein CG18335 [Anabrus simplex]|uniref:CIMIP2 protein CG18335 n=1 Tax=Anabrus simplex TaxID=316456 RepID=UPI0034DCDC17